jgi:hypothetical protein
VGLIQTCPFCSKEIPDISFFCSFCGKRIREETEENELNVSERVVMSIQKSLNGLKLQTSKFLTKLEQKVDSSQSMSFVNKQRILNLLDQIQGRDRIEIKQEAPEISEWVTYVEEAISGEKCIICLQDFETSAETKTRVILCPECNYAGHVKHFLDWLDKKKSCPMCRSELHREKLLRGFLSVKGKNIVFTSWEKNG